MRTVSRREVLRAGVGAAGAATGLGLLAGCGPHGPEQSGAAAPQAGPAPIEIVWAPWGGWPAYAGKNWHEFIQPGIAYFEQQNPGIRLRLQAPGGGGSFLTSILTGQGPDVFQDWEIGSYRAANVVVDLSPYLRRDNIDPALWSPGQMHAMQDANGIQFLPCYVHVSAMAVNYSILDAIGLAYPTPNWTYQQAARLYGACAGNKLKTTKYGVSMYFNGTSMGDAASMDSYVFHFFGGSLAAPDRVTCEVGKSASYQGVQWVADLYRQHIISPTERDSDLLHIPFVEVGSNSLPTQLTAWRDNFKWSYFPVPAFPGGQFSFEATDYYAINAGTKHLEQAWTLLRFLSAEPYWSRYCMKYLLRTPSIVSLWNEYVTVVESVAPVVKGKGLQYFTEAAQKWGIANTVFRFSQGQVANLLNAQLARVRSGAASVPLAMGEAARQVDALEATAAKEAATRSAVDKLFPTSGPAIAPVPTGI